MQIYEINDPNEAYDGENLNNGTCKTKIRKRTSYKGYLKLGTGFYAGSQNRSTICRRIKR